MEWQEEPGVYPAGEHTAWVTPSGMIAEVRKDGWAVKRFQGESAWSDAVRAAGDLNSKEKS